MMRYLHTMVRVADLDRALAFWRDALGLEEISRMENHAGRFTLVFLAAPGDAERARAEKAPLLELTYNWDPEDYTGGRNFGHLAYRVPDIYATVRAAGRCRRDHQPPAARRPYGLRPLARRHLDRTAAGRRAAAARRALGLNAEHWQLVRREPAYPLLPPSFPHGHRGR